MDLFVKYYNSLVGADYDKISEFICRVIRKYKKDSELVCDLGCGTGEVAARLSHSGFDMIAIDSSEDMLAKASESFKKRGLSDILLLCQDITEFELYGTVDVIYATLDTVNYVTSKNELTRLFKLVRNYLNYDGLFIFDVNTEYKFKSILSGKDFVYDNDDFFCSWSAYFDKKTDYCYHELVYFERGHDGNYKRSLNTQVQRYYSQEYLNALFDRFSFKIIKRCDDYSSKKVTDKTERITYVLRINK